MTIKVNVFRCILAIILINTISCASTRSIGETSAKQSTSPPSDVQTSFLPGSPFGPAREFIGSPYAGVGLTGLFDVHPQERCRIAVLPNGDRSLAARIQSLKNADTSVRIQALIFRGDESGLYIAGLLKEKKAQGLDVRVIVDAVSNLGPQTQWMYFDLKQNGIEVQGYEAMYLEWLNEVPVITHDAADNTVDPNKRHHEKMWIIDGDTDHRVAVVGGLNVANEYFRVDPRDPGGHWRDQDVIVRGDAVKDMVATFERNFDYFQKIKESRGIFNTNLYWEAARNIFETTGKMYVDYSIDERLAKNVRELADRTPDLEYKGATCRFFQNRPRFGETYLEQVYLKSIRGSNREILVGNAYFVASQAFVETIKEAARRCVKVILLTNSPGTNDLPMLNIVGREYYDDMLAVNEEPVVRSCDGGGLQIWEWQGHRRGGAEKTDGTIHAKYAVFDRRVSIVGSYNLDPRSRALNSETAIVFESVELSRELAGLFYKNDLDFSERITLEDARAFPEATDAIYEFQKEFGILFEDEL